MSYRVDVRWLILLAVGCGPIVYVNQVTNHASTLVDQARHADAAHLAPYWYTRATQYLHLSHEDAARADFQGANHFGRLAAEAAQHAIDDAAVAKKDPAKRPIEERPVPAKDQVAPAKDAP